jgi:4-hydroxythreonine-4-phosphate dehydrogenase
MGLPKIALALGDPAGIGPEIVLKALLDERVRAVCVPVAVGDRRALERHAGASGIALDLAVIRSAEEIGATARPGAVELLDLPHLRDEPLAIGEMRAAHGRAAVAAARAAIDLALARRVDAVIAAPQTELAIKEAGIEFDGYPSFVARATGTAPEDAFLMLCFDDKFITHATLHVSLRRAIDLLTPARLAKVIAATHETLSQLGHPAPRIAVAGLNPHASEHGLFGSEESEVLEPAVAAARRGGIDVEGPFGADTMFQRGGYAAFIVMYHDQGHIAAKLLARNRTAGMTIGTPILFSSVAHGSALDIAGRNRASPAAVIEAVERLAGAATRRERTLS